MSNSIDLKQIIGNSDDYVDNTNKIRQLKHSMLIKENINDIKKLRANNFNMYKNNFQDFRELCIQKNNFLFNNYFDLFNKILNDEIDLNIMNEFIRILKKIEDGETDQHNGSVMVGELLKKIYVDSAIKRGEKLDQKNKELNPQVEEEIVEPKNISWKQYKNKF
jgi:hypothetical protein